MMSPRGCFVVSAGTSERVFMVLPRESLVFSCKTVEHRSRKSRDLLQTGEITVSFQCNCMRTVHVCSFVSRSSISPHGSGWALSFFWTLCLKTFHLGTVCVCLAWSSPLPRYCCCVDCLYLRSGYLIFYCINIVKLETGDSQDLKYGVYRIIGRGATVQSVSRCS